MNLDNLKAEILQLCTKYGYNKVVLYGDECWLINTLSGDQEKIYVYDIIKPLFASIGLNNLEIS